MSPRTGLCSWLSCGLLLLPGAIGLAQAQTAALSLTPFVSGEYRYESNLFRLSRIDAAALGVTTTGDSVQRYGFGADARYLREQQSVRARIEGYRQVYGRFDALDHSGHRVDVTAEGALPGPLSGELSLLNERRIAAFEDRRSTERSLERESEIGGELRLAVSPRYAVFGGTRHRTLESPIPAAPARVLPPPGLPARPASPDFRARETAYSVGLVYGLAAPADEDVAPFTARLGLEQQRVRFDDLNRPVGEPIPDDDGYELLILATEVTYVVSGLSTLDAEIGATRYRNRDGAGDSPVELTGDIRYQRALTALTAVEVGLFRRIELDSATADTTTDTGFRLGVNWAPRPAILLSASHERAQSAFEGLSGVAPANRGRKDRTETTEIAATALLWRSSSLRLFGRFGERDSRSGGDDYRDDRYGVQLKLQMR